MVNAFGVEDTRISKGLPSALRGEAGKRSAYRIAAKDPAKGDSYAFARWQANNMGRQNARLGLLQPTSIRTGKARRLVARRALP